MLTENQLNHYREILEGILLEHEKIPYGLQPEIYCEAVFDRTRDRYLLVNLGWDKGKRVRGSILHVDIIDGKFWIHDNNTEYNLASQLVSRGVPKEHIVLAFQSPERRQYSGYAVA